MEKPAALKQDDDGNCIAICREGQLQYVVDMMTSEDISERQACKNFIEAVQDNSPDGDPLTSSLTVDKVRSQIRRDSGLGQSDPTSKPVEANFSGNQEWYTPSQYIESARKVMGSIDVDPASNRIAQEVVQAGKFYTKKNDGLLHDWEGTLWLNPPYTAGLMDGFIDKAVNSPAVTQAVILTHSRTDTTWFHQAATACNALCLTRGRINFLRGGEEVKGSSVNGSSFFYFGENADGFKKEFAQYGLVFPALNLKNGNRVLDPITLFQ